MIKADIVNKVADKMPEVSRFKAAQAVDTVIDGLRNALARGQRIELRGFDLAVQQRLPEPGGGHLVCGLGRR